MDWIDDTGTPNDIILDTNVPLFAENLISAFAMKSDVSPSLRVAVFGDAGNSNTNGTNFYYSPGAYRRLDLGATGPQQQAVAEMMRSWNPSDLIQLGDESYNVNSSSHLDINIGQYYNDFIYPYAPPAFTQPGSVYTDGELGGIPASEGRTQWPYNIYNYPYGFPNPSDPSKPGGSSDGVNHYFAVPGNHDEATILGTYNDASVNQENFKKKYIGQPLGPDAYDYQNNINTTPPPPNNGDFNENGVAKTKTGSNQQLFDYHSYLGAGNPGNLKPGSLKIGKLDPNGYGIYYSVDLGDDGTGRPLVHVTMIDTNRLLTDAGYYEFNFQKKAGGNPGYDVRNPQLTAQQAQFQPDNLPADAPSIGRQMFLWAKADLDQSDAAWNIVMGHHPAYHSGTPKSDDDDSYSSNAVVLNFLQGLRDSSGNSQFQAYMNGHDHNYQRAQEMQASADGIGTGIPFFTIGDSGKALGSLNLSPYGTNVLEPINYSTFIGYDLNGRPLFNTDLNDASVEAPYLAPYQAGLPTSTGQSGYYSYSSSNYPAYDGRQAPFDPAKPEDLSSREIIAPDGRAYSLKTPAYLTYLNSSQTDLSGLYGFGSGAAQLDAGDTYLMVHYQTAQTIDPAIALIGRNQGVSSFDPASLFYRQWSPRSAKLEDLGLFSFDIDQGGSLTNVQIVQSGNGYFESDLAASTYLSSEQDFEILGNNPTHPLGFNSSDPSRAVVRLSFNNGQLVKVALINKGSDYQQLANAIRQSNVNGPTLDPSKPATNNSLLVGINIDLEAQYTLAATRPAGSEPYQDWYLITDTGLASARAQAAGAFGSVSLNLQARSQEARDILMTTPITTGYSGQGPQNKRLAPGQGGLKLIDAFGSTIGQASVADGQAAVTLNALAAPGAVRVNFDGDALSSYQVNFRSISSGDDVQLNLNYGSFSGPLQVQDQQLQLASAQRLQVIRTDSGIGRVDFGLSQDGASLSLVQQAKGASQASLKADQLFRSDAASNWQSSEGQAQGGAGSALVAMGSWRPTAVLNGQGLRLDNLELASNGVVARFAAGRPNDSSDDVLATFGLPGTGVAPAVEPGVLTVRRLSGMANGMALYAADPVTGAVTDANGTTWLPEQAGYLPAALAAAQLQGLVLHAQDLPDFGQTKQFNALPLSLSQNYGALLLVDDKDTDLISSFAAANPNQTNQCLSLIAPGRGVSFSFEDKLPGLGSDRDFNDLSFTLTALQPTVSL